MKLLSVMRDDAETHPKIARDRLLLAIGFYTGLRISDILSLTWMTVSETRSWTLVEKKTKKKRTMDINPKLSKIVAQTVRYCDIHDYHNYIFVGTRGPATHRPVTIKAVNDMIKAVFLRYDIQTDNASSHTLRKTFGRRVYEYNGRSEDALILLSKMFNHRNLQVTREYIGLTGERIRSVYTSI